MKIVIAGGGDVGYHLATLLSSEQQDIILIDCDQDVLDNVNVTLDVQTVAGDASSIATLQKAEIGDAKLFLAVTTSDNVNLVSAMLAKQMGVKVTVARVSKEEFSTSTNKAIFKNLGVDEIISPASLAAEEITRLLSYEGVTDSFSFEDDTVNLFGIYLNQQSDLIGKTVYEVNEKYKDLHFRTIAILRGRDTLIPESHLILSKKDHVYFLTDKKHRAELLPSLGIEKGAFKKVMIIGGGHLGRITAKLLEDNYKVTIVDDSPVNCEELANTLSKALIIKGKPNDIQLLIDEGLENSDVFLALTDNSQANILSSLMAANHGIRKTIALVDDDHHIHLSQHIGVDTLINKKLIAANEIFRYVRKGKIEAIVSLHGVNAEVIEFIIQNKKNRLTKQPIKKLNMPKGAIIGTVLRGGESLIPDPDFTFEPGDKVIVLAVPEAIHRVESLFK